MSDVCPYCKMPDGQHACNCWAPDEYLSAEALAKKWPDSPDVPRSKQKPYVGVVAERDHAVEILNEFVEVWERLPSGYYRQETSQYWVNRLKIVADRARSYLHLPTEKEDDDALADRTDH